MEFSLDPGDSQFKIQSYSHGHVYIAGRRYACPLLVMPQQLIAPWGPPNIEDLNASYFQDILVLSPQVVLLGTGEKQLFLDSSLFASLTEHHIGVELMSSAAACRSYTLLMAEGRQVAAILY